MQLFRKKSKQIVEGVLKKDMMFREWDLYMDGYCDTVIPKGKVVKVHFLDGVPVTINTMTKNTFTGLYNYVQEVQMWLPFINIKK